MSTRRVRVTMEGAAEQASHMPSVLRVQLDGHGHVYVDTAARGVTVEELAPPRTWTDGDVVQGIGPAWSRVDGQWLQPDTFGGSHAARDTDVDAEVNAGRWLVLRYQYAEDDSPAPHSDHCPDPCRHDAECPHGKAWTAGETCTECVGGGR